MPCCPARPIAAIASALALMCGVTVLADAQDLAAYSGAQLYQRYCVACHGVRGLGDGPVASELKVMVPDLTRIAKRHGGMFPEDDVRRIIDGREVHMAHGTRAMPVWGIGLGSDSSIGRLVEYLRSIQSQ